MTRVIKRTVDTVSPAVAREAYAVENESLYAVFGDEVLELARRLVDAGIQTREGEMEHEKILNSM